LNLLCSQELFHVEAPLTVVPSTVLAWRGSRDTFSESALWPLSCPIWNLLSRYLQGWAIKGAKKATRFNENQRQYLDNKFQIGQESGHKADSENSSRDMRYARRDNGERRFNVEEFLTAQQI